MTKNERLEKYGYSPRRIFGDWYFVRLYPRTYSKHNILKRILKHIRIVVKIKSDDNFIVKPRGQFRTS